MYKRVVSIFFALMVALPAEAGVVLKVMATNPSELEEQGVVVKSYLPEGMTPESVVDKGELELAYDVKQEQYYVYKEVKLKPKASVTYEVEIEDIWLIEENKLNALEIHTEELAEKLKRTEYEDVAEKLAEVIEKKVTAILQKQTISTIDKVSPGEHINAYEANKEMLDTVKEDVGTLENLVISLGQDPGVIMGEGSTGAKAVGTSEDAKAAGVKLLAGTIFKGKAPSTAATWKIIFIIIGFLGIVSLLFFLRWHLTPERKTRRIEEERKE